MPEDRPHVSVIMATYNHAPFIGKAIESALKQETSFEVEILVGDDCSTDGTSGIVADFAGRFPDRIRVLAPEKNEGAHANFSRLYRAARGDYVAQLEGDDYWTESGKLQKQVDFLQENPSFALCFHNLEIEFEGQEDRHGEVTNSGDPEVSGLDRLTRFNYIGTSSSVFRNRLIEDLPDWVHDLPMGDWPLFVLLAEHGKIRYFDEVMGVYRVHAGGVWSRQADQSRLINTVHAAEVCRKRLGHPGFSDCIFKTSKTIADAAWEEGAYLRALKYRWKRGAAYLGDPGYFRGRRRKS